MNRRARATLERALTADPTRAVTDAARGLLLGLLIYEDVDPLPIGLVAPLATTAPAASLKPHLGILPGPDEGADATSQPASAAPTAAEPPRLTADSLVLRAAEAACEAGDFQRAARLVERALPYVAAGERGPWRLLLGRCRIELGHPAEGAADLLNLAETDNDRGRAALALYYVALAHERLGRADVARPLYEELAQRAEAPEDVKTRARAALQRLKP